MQLFWSICDFIITLVDHIMLRITQFTQAIFCIVSMTLTGMFALSLSGFDVNTLSEQEKFESSIFLAVMFVLIGCCIDIGKYIFWMQRHRSVYYGFLSLILMAFSWVASCAFLISSEDRLLQDAQIKTSEFLAYEHRVENIKQEIQHQEQLLSNRLNSSFHSQWEAGQENSNKISELQESLAVLFSGESSIGQVAAAEQVSTTRFFSVIGDVFNIDANIIRSTAYGVLSLLLEICTLGMISLTQILKDAELNANDALEKCVKVKKPILSDQNDVGELISDILSGKVPPVLRKIVAAKYGCENYIVRNTLKHLYESGLLEKDKRNSYKLTEQNEYN